MAKEKILQAKIPNDPKAKAREVGKIRRAKEVKVRKQVQKEE